MPSLLPVLFAVGCAVGLASCKHTTPPIVGQAYSHWPGFGEPAAGTVQVTVGGHVEHPGVYYFHRGMTVAAACAVAGAEQAGYGYIEPLVTLRRVDGKVWRYDPRMSEKLRRKVADMELLDGDRLNVGLFIH